MAKGSAVRRQDAGSAGQIPGAGQQYSPQRDIPPGKGPKLAAGEAAQTGAGQPLPAQEQAQQPGLTAPMRPAPRDRAEGYLAAGKLSGKVALISGGDSGIGRSVAVHFAKEGADVCILYLSEHEDARATARLVEAEGRSCTALAGDIGDAQFCRRAVEQCIAQLGGLHVLVNNAAEQHEQKDFADISDEQLERTFRTNIFGMFYLTRAALPQLAEGSAIINTASITAYQGHETLVDYASTKGAIVAFTRSLSASLAPRGIRVNGVAPGPIWTPLIPASFDAEKVARHGGDTPLGRVGEPDDCAPAYVYLACRDSAFVTGQMLHVNGGTVVGG